MIDIFNKKTSYNDALIGNGLYQLDKLVISAETNEDIYGNYELNISLELQVDAPTELYELIEIDSIIKVKDEGGEELFRIATVEKGLETIEIYCRHITISDSLNLWLNNVKPTELDGMSALQWLAQRTTPKCNLILSSNLANRSTANYVRKNLYEALVDGDNSFLNRWGGEIKRTGYTINIRDRLGQDKSDSIIVKEALNLVDFNANTNVDDISTVIYPVAFDGILGERVVSPLVDRYSMEFPTTIKYEDVRLKEVNDQGEVTHEGWDTEDQVKAELKRRAEEEFSKNNLDKVKIECDIDYIDLSKYEEYKDIAELQRTNLGDYISVRVDTYAMDIKARVVGRVYDVLRGKRVNNTISTSGTLKKPQDIHDIVKDLQDKIEGEAFEDLSGYIDSMISQGMKDSYVVLERNRLLAMDNKDKNLAKKVIVLNKNGLGFSSTGIGGPFTYGFTIDGKLNADMITSGAMSGIYIKGGTIEANRLTVGAKKEISDQFGKSDAFIQLDASVVGLSSTVGKVDNKVNAQSSQISKIEQQANKIELSVEDKVGKDSIISSINLSKEGIKIKASKLEVTGDFITKSDLVDGVTKISGSNIKTGTINAIDIEGSNIRGAHITGTQMLYMAEGGTMSCDGNTYIKNLYIPETHPGWTGIGSFSCGPSAFFDNSVHIGEKKGQVWVGGVNGSMGVVRRDNQAWIQVDRIGIQSGSSAYLEIPGYQSNHVYGVDLWYSDQALKENVEEITTSVPTPLATKKIGLDLVKNIKHYKFDYKTTKKVEGEPVETTTTPVACGYISQDLNKYNDQLTQAIKQGDGSTLLSPRPSFIIPNITLAIQEQQQLIEAQQQKIEDLEARLVALESKLK